MATYAIGSPVIVIIGAGVCGLATAYELSRRGENAIVIERGEPFAGQSAGLARIFRIAHRRPELCRLAVRARAGWQRWEAELGAGRLLGSEGFVAAGAPEVVAAAMTKAGAAFSRLDRAAIAARIPFLAAPWDSAIFDPLGGSLRTRRALTASARRVAIRRGEVVSVGAACLSAPEGYGLPLGSTGRWAFGQEVPDPAIVRALFPSLSPVGRVDCVTVRAPWLDAGGDGWTVASRGRVVGFVGANLMKFGPLLGELLARAVLSHEIPADLAAV